MILGVSCALFKLMGVFEIPDGEETGGDARVRDFREYCRVLLRVWRNEEVAEGCVRT